MRDRRYRRSLFTLIEILVVMVIIVVLAGVLMAGTRAVFDKMRKSKAEAQIQAITLAFESHYNDRGYYPQQPTSGKIPKSLIDGVTNSSTGQLYLNVKDVGLSYDKNDFLVDPWFDGDDKGFWYYQCPGTHNVEKFDLWSHGADQDGYDGNSVGTLDVNDITNWRRN